MRYKIVLLLTFISYAVMSQSTINCSTFALEEEIILHTDRDRYIAGEVIWFKAYCLENGALQSEFSKVLYIELFGDKNNTFIQQKYELVQGTASGVLTIPTDINTGNYFLRAYTQYQRNFPTETFFTQVVSIVNPNSEYQEIEIPQTTEQNPTATIHEPKKVIPLTIKTSKPSYHQRELVDINIDFDFEKTPELSITVRKKGSGYDSPEIAEFIDFNPWLSNSFSFNSGMGKSSIESPGKTGANQIKWLPEFRSLTLSGKIRNKETKAPVSNVVCLSSVVDPIPQIHLSETHEDGSFIFSFNELKGDHNLYLGLYPNTNIETLEILVNNDFDNSFPKIKAIPLVYDTDLNEIFEALFMNYQLSNRFEVIKPKETFSIDNSSYLPFNLRNPDLIIATKSFINLPTLEDIFREIVPGVFLNGTKGKRSFTVFSKRDNFSYKNPLLLLDNVPVSDIDKLMLTPPSLIDTIAVYSAGYILGDHTLRGIISIKTQTDNFASYTWDDNSVFVPFKAISQSRAFLYPDYSNSDTGSNPDFRTTLYWNPSINSKSSTALQFYASDHNAVYEVIVKGFKADGTPCFGTAEFEVKKKPTN